MYTVLQWTSLHNVTKYVNHKWFIHFKAWRYVTQHHMTSYDKKNPHGFEVSVCFVALRLKSTAMVMAGQSVHLTTLYPGQA